MLFGAAGQAVRLHSNMLSSVARIQLTLKTDVYGDPRRCHVTYEYYHRHSGRGLPLCLQQFLRSRMVGHDVAVSR